MTKHLLVFLIICILVVFSIASSNTTSSSDLTTQYPQASDPEYRYGIKFAFTGASANTNLCDHLYKADEALTDVLNQGGLPYAKNERIIESKICGITGKVDHMIIPSLPEYKSPDQYRMEYMGWITIPDIKDDNELLALGEKLRTDLSQEKIAKILNKYIPSSINKFPVSLTILTILPTKAYNACFAGESKAYCGVDGETGPEPWASNCMRCDPKSSCTSSKGCTSYICDKGICGDYYIHSKKGGSGNNIATISINGVIGLSLLAILTFLL